MQRMSLRHLFLVSLAVTAWSVARASAEEFVQPMRDTDIVARVNGTPIQRRAVKDVVQGALLEQDNPPDPATVGKLANDALDSLIDFE